MGKHGHYGMREVPFGISYSKEGSLVPRKDVVKTLLCYSDIPSRQGLLYLIEIEIALMAG